MGQRLNRGEGRDLGGKSTATRLGNMSMTQLMNTSIDKRPGYRKPYSPTPSRKMREFTPAEAQIAGVPPHTMHGTMPKVPLKPKYKFDHNKPINRYARPKTTPTFKDKSGKPNNQ
jgi:hypothetical protein